MDQKPITSPPRGERKTHVRHDAATWALIRADWESGLNDRQCGERHDQSTSNVWRHRRREAWTRPEPIPPPPEIKNCKTLDELLQFSISEILSAYKAEGHQAAREIAKSAEVFLRLQLRMSPRRGAAPDTDEPPVFKPERDVFELLNELGLKPEDVL